MPITINKDNHQQEILESTKPVLIDIYAPWCGPCQMMDPLIEELQREYSDKILIAKLNVDEDRELAIHYSISSIPTFLFIKNGNVVHTKVGSQSKQQLVESIQSYLL